MRHPANTKHEIFGFILAVVMTVVLSDVSFGASRFVISSSNVTAPASVGQPIPPDDVRSFGFVSAAAERNVVIVQQVEPESMAGQSTADKVYVPPQWVETGSGVEIARPGYWIDPQLANER